MVTVLDALAVYNAANNKNYLSLAALGADLARAALKQAWTTKKTNDAFEAAQVEAGVL